MSLGASAIDVYDMGNSLPGAIRLRREMSHASSALISHTTLAMDFVHRRSPPL